MNNVTRVRKRYLTPELHSASREQFAEMVTRRLAMLYRVLPEHDYMWTLLYQRLGEGAEPLDVLHLANRYALGVCLRAAVDLNLETKRGHSTCF
jgi:hypothetical protein